MHVLENEPDFGRKLEKSVGFTLELRDDPLLRPDDFKLLIKSAGRELAHHYAAAS
jgi:ribonuclease G